MIISGAEHTKGFSRLVLPVTAAYSLTRRKSAKPASRKLLELRTNDYTGFG